MYELNDWMEQDVESAIMNPVEEMRANWMGLNELDEEDDEALDKWMSSDTNKRLIAAIKTSFGA